METLWDIAMFTMSVGAAIRNPSLENIAGAIADGISVVTPVPSIAGTARHGGRLISALDDLGGAAGKRGGRRGGRVHRETTQRAQAEIAARRPELEHVAGGCMQERLRGGRYPDLEYRDKVTGRRYFFQIGDTLKSQPDVPVARERRAMDDLMRLGFVEFIRKGSL